MLARPPLRSETEADQAALRNRLARLRARQAAVQLRALVTDVWSGLVADWKVMASRGGGAVTRARQRMSRSQAWREVAGRACAPTTTTCSTNWLAN